MVKVRPQDFDVHYRFLTEQEGGRKTGPPFQGYKSDWAYAGDNIDETGLWMIWPLFEDGQGTLVPVGQQVPAEGIARMLIANQALRKEVHRNRIAVGVRGFLMEGGKKVAEAEVVRVVGLHLDE